MNFFLILPYYLVWHYGRAYHDIKNVWKDFLVFIYHFFSIPILLSTFFSPWQRVREGYNAQSPIFETLIFNTIMRIIGMMMRLFIILLGLFCFLACLILGIVFFILWFTLPILMFSMLSVGIELILNK